VSIFVSCLILLAERTFKVGDRVEIENLTGDVIRIASRGTWVRSNDNLLVWEVRTVLESQIPCPDGAAGTVMGVAVAWGARAGASSH